MSGADAVHLDANCGTWGMSTTTAIGYVRSGGVAPGTSSLLVTACATFSAAKSRILLGVDGATSVGTYKMPAAAAYKDDQGVDWGGTDKDTTTTVITRFDDVGGAIDGTINGKLTQDGQGSLTIAGSFHVCRVLDEDVP
jgi:hypothetical protein